MMGIGGKWLAVINLLALNECLKLMGYKSLKLIYFLGKDVCCFGILDTKRGRLLGQPLIKIKTY